VKRLHGLAETHAFGAELARHLRAGDLVVLSGPLGAGKTALTQGIGAGLGVTEDITSPTFVLARVHPGRVMLVHVDAYRLREAGQALGDMDDLDLDVDLEHAVVVVEWGEGIVEGLSDSRLEVHLDRPDPDDADLRTAHVITYGPRWD
jgi:tRNA threonylcarbamoyladenosine biosynthesis protein TsaE